MKVNKNYEVELNLKDLLFHVLYNWRFIIITALIVAGVLAFLEYWGFEKYHRVGELTPAEMKYEADLNTNQNAIEKAEKTLAEFESLSQWENRTGTMSILMGIDPSNIWTAEKKYLVDIDPDSIKSIVIEGGEDSAGKVLAILSEAFSVNIEKEKLQEVFGTDARRDINEIASICIDPNMKTLSVIGCGNTAEEANKRMRFVDSYLIEANDKLSKYISYKLVEISDSVGTRTLLVTKDVNGEKIEKNLASLQSSLNEKYTNYQNQVLSYTKNLNDLRAKVIEKPTPQIKKQVLLGFVLGAFIVIVFCSICYFFSGKIKTGREIKNRYDVCLLSDFTHSRALWKGKGIDWILEKLEFGKKTNVENELDSIASLIDKSRNGTRILLTSTLEKKRIEKIFEGLGSRLKEKGIDLNLEAEYLHNSSAVEESGQMDSVLIVEEKYKSRVRDLNRMAEMINIEEAKVIGTILL